MDKCLIPANDPERRAPALAIAWRGRWNQKSIYNDEKF
jgi:hypothetical protein